MEIIIVNKILINFIKSIEDNFKELDNNLYGNFVK
jgi:site-specific DNA-adenine methylase